MPRKNTKCLVYLQEVANYINYICKLSEHNFWWSCLEFSDKLDLNIQRRILNNLKHRQAICLKFGERCFTFLGLEANASICSVVKENPILYHRKFSTFVVAILITTTSQQLFLAKLNCVQYHLGQILVTVEKLLNILEITTQLLSNF